METDHSDLFGSLGFIFPQNSSQLQYFKVIYGDYQYKANEAAINPNRILQKIHLDSVKATGVDFHKRLVLAAEIVYQLQEDSHMGHLKLEKVLYLCMNVNNISFYANFLKQAMGPYDPAMIRSLDKQFEKNRWFKYNYESFPKYVPLENVGQHKLWFNRYFSNHTGDIDSLINTFSVFTGNQIELVATIFECWKEILEDKQQFDIDLITTKVYAWSEAKAKFTTNQIANAVSWMEDKGIFPTSNK